MTADAPFDQNDFLFCRIAHGDVTAHEVYRGDRVVAFLDICPIRTGHVQISPIAHYETFEQLPLNLVTEIVGLGQKVAHVQKRLYGVDRVAFLFTGSDIPHVHAHVVPIVEKTDITSRRYIVEEDVTWRDLPTPGDPVLASTAEVIAQGLRDQGLP
ncbi:MAG: HIT domain-containing protein [Pseudomonadota bacterium]